MHLFRRTQKVKSHIHELEFFDGMPNETTVKKSIDFLDLSKAVEVFLNSMPAASIYALLDGMKKNVAEPGDLVLWETMVMHAHLH